MTKKEVPKNANKFSCERSDFTCSKESNYKDIQWHGNIKYELIRTKKCQKTPNNIITIMVKCFLVFYFIVFLMSTWIPFWIFYNFSMKNFCKYINFYSRPWRMIVSKLAKELYTNWGNKSYPYCFIYFHLFLFSFSFFSQNKFYFEKFKQSYILFKIFQWTIFVKKHEILFQTIMLLFPFFKIYFVTIIFFNNLWENNIGVFYLSIVYEEWRMYLRQKAPRNFLVRNVTLNVVKEVIGVDI